MPTRSPDKSSLHPKDPHMQVLCTTDLETFRDDFFASECVLNGTGLKDHNGGQIQIRRPALHPIPSRDLSSCHVIDRGMGKAKDI